jgi:hypothetical protein
VNRIRFSDAATADAAQLARLAPYGIRGIVTRVVTVVDGYGFGKGGVSTAAVSLPRVRFIDGALPFVPRTMAVRP